MKEKYIPIIQKIANDVRKSKGLDNGTIIGDYIFAVLQQECVVMMRPLRHQPDLDGFSTEKIIKGELKTVVFINTAKSVEKQNFCAAHELGHRYKIDRLIQDEFPDDIILPSDTEEIMNRFAAELMMSERDFIKRSNEIWYERGTYNDSRRFQITVKECIQTIIELMDFYYMPYKAVLYRMAEVGRISEDNRDYLEKFGNGNKSVVDKIISDMGITRLRTPDYKIQNSISVNKKKEILENSQITKYLTDKELAQYSKNLGLSRESTMLVRELRKIETEMLDISEK